MNAAQRFRKAAVALLSDEIGVYALCDLDGQPIYVGQSVDGIRSRVRRHLTSARSDVIANRQVDVWEIAYVMAWPVQSLGQVKSLEGAIFTHFDAQQALMNGKIEPEPQVPVLWPDHQRVQVIEESERLQRLDPAQRLPRQISQYNLLVDYILNVKDAAHLKRSLDAHLQRLVKYHKTFL